MFPWHSRHSPNSSLRFIQLCVCSTESSQTMFKQTHPLFFQPSFSLPTLPTGSLENWIFTDIFPTGKMQLSQLHGSPPVLYGCFAMAKGHAVRSNHQNQNLGRWSAMAVETVGWVWCKVGVPSDVVHGCQWFGCLSGGGTVACENGVFAAGWKKWSFVDVSPCPWLPVSITPVN